jgi:hypothetical protein
MSWNKEGQQVAGVYLNAYTVVGTVALSRVKYGGRVQHTVDLVSPIEIFGTIRDTILLDEEDLFQTT